MSATTQAKASVRNRRAKRLAAKRPAEVADALRRNVDHLTAVAVEARPDALALVEATTATGKRSTQSPLMLLRMLALHPRTPWRDTINGQRVEWTDDAIRQWQAAVDADLIERASGIEAGGWLSLLTVAVESFLPDHGERPVLPVSTIGASYRRDDGEALPDLLGPGPAPGDQLPMFESGAPAGYGALVAYDATGASTWKRGRGVPIPARLFVEALLLAQAESVIVAPTLREVRDALYPHGWRRNENLPMIRRALYEVHNHAIPWRRGMDWIPVTVRTVPTPDADLDDRIEFDVRLPADPAPGARVHRPTLHRLGVFRAAEWRLYLSLCAYWDRRGYRDGGWNVRLVPEVERDRDGLILGPNGKPLRLRSGAPVRKWSDPRATRTGKRIEPDRRPATLSAEDLRRMVFPARPGLPAGTLRRQRKAAADALAELERRGIVETVEDGGGVRVYRLDGDLRTSER